MPGRRVVPGRWRIGTSRSYAWARHSAATGLGSNLFFTSRYLTWGLFDFRTRASWPDRLRTLLLSIGLPGRSAKALPIGRSQLLARETYEEFYATFCNIVGGVVSPFLSNIVLDELDKELERRGHRFVRYADDSHLYVKSERAGRRVLARVSHFLTQRLKLRVNAAKSAVDKPQQRTCLGFTFTGGKSPTRRKIAPKAVARFKAKVRELTRRTWGSSLAARLQRLTRYLNGWREYHGYCETPAVLQDLDSWIRRRLRCVQWKQWKGYKRRKAELIRRGVAEALATTTAWSAKGPWRACHTAGVQIALPTAYFDALGLPRLASRPNM
jgi:hypothetical protein